MNTLEWVLIGAAGVYFLYTQYKDKLPDLKHGLLNYVLGLVGISVPKKTTLLTKVQAWETLYDSVGPQVQAKLDEVFSALNDDTKNESK